MVEAGVGVGFVLKHAVLDERTAKVGAGRTEHVPARRALVAAAYTLTR